MHTPGPWKLRREGVDGVHGYIEGAAETYGGWTLAKVVIHNSEDEDNARLIVSAPDLLETAKKADRWLSLLVGAAFKGATIPQGSALVIATDANDLRAAIAKAEGH